ncbi:MAG: hypothetical protein IJM52_03555, partial [Spirochaetales bacterium]|nr:hypothetical protein [Spirochaetales bacterium]
VVEQETTTSNETMMIIATAIFFIFSPLSIIIIFGDVIISHQEPRGQKKNPGATLLTCLAFQHPNPIFHLRPD